MSWEFMPNVFIIGAAKCGTTALVDTIKQHPQIYIPFAKEPRFFTDDRLYTDKGLQWYRETFFNMKESYPVRMDASTPYIYWSEKSARRIKDDYQDRDVRIIAQLRDPVQRAYSFYWHSRRYEREDLPFTEALASEEKRIQENWERFQAEGRQDYGYVRGGLYARNLEPFLERFPRENFHFILLEDLQRNYEETITRLLRFLKIDPIELSKVVSNKAGLPIHTGLNRYLTQSHGILRTIFGFIPLSIRHNFKRMLINANIRRIDYSPMPPEVEKELRRKFHDDIKKLETIIHRDLSHWLNGPK